MDTTITLQGKPVVIHLTDRAAAAVQQRANPLYVEMELYFSCLIRKKVRFHEKGSDTAIPASDNLLVGFRPVMTAQCNMTDEFDEPPLTDFPIKNAQAYIPRWLRIDYRSNNWSGEFGY